jgi:16S rRNA (guanine(527)-N(7))-methyltransferase RsmG
VEEAQFQALVKARFPELNDQKAAQTAKYRALLAAENQRQNLTRLIEPEDFLQGHLEDVLALEKSSLLGLINLDMGSGGGVPGLLSAALFGKSWILTDSESRKAEFLSRAVSELGIQDHVRVFGERAENVLLRCKVDTVVARAVGPIERILGWIGRCSTWNSLILFKGPSWGEEWATFQRSGKGTKYQIANEYSYRVGQSQEKSRVLVSITRVPRGTEQTQ